MISKDAMLVCSYLFWDARPTANGEDTILHGTEYVTAACQARTSWLLWTPPKGEIRDRYGHVDAFCLGTAVSPLSDTGSVWGCAFARLEQPKIRYYIPDFSSLFIHVRCPMAVSDGSTVGPTKGRERPYEEAVQF